MLDVSQCRRRTLWCCLVCIPLCLLPVAANRASVEPSVICLRVAVDPFRPLHSSTGSKSGQVNCTKICSCLGRAARA